MKIYKQISLLSIIVATLLITFCASAKSLNRVNNWGYQLQNINLNTLIKSPFDLLVIDYSKDGTNPNAFTKTEIQKIKKKGKIVLAYLSIGEAEDYRFYWNPAWNKKKPKFIGPENPEWKGNYKIKYWEEGWFDYVLKPYLDQIIAAGFDGVYLDIIDAYYYWGHDKKMGVKGAADQMVKLLVKIADYTRKKAGKSFIICPQNGLGIINDASLEATAKFLKTINAVGVESLFFNTTAADRDYRLTLLEKFAEYNKKIFNIEYIKKSKEKKYKELLNSQPFTIIGYRSTADRQLNKLITK